MNNERIVIAAYGPDPARTREHAGVRGLRFAIVPNGTVVFPLPGARKVDLDRDLPDFAYF